MTDEDLRDMQERVTQIRELQQHPSWAIYEDFLRHKLSISQRRVVNGLIEDMGVYKHETGIVKGLMTALTAGDEVERLVESELERRAEQGY